jgi:hypothetical protein
VKVKRILFSVAPFLIMLAVTFGAGRYSAMVSAKEGHGAKGAFGFDSVLILAFVIVAVAVIGALAYTRYTSKKEESGR